MTAIFKKEVKGFLTSMIGYVFIAFLLVVCGIYFTAYHLQGAYPQFAYTLQSVLFVFLIAVPVLTMRVLAEERRQKTDQLLLTSPVSVTGIVLGKYLALVTVYGIAVIVLAVYPLILSQFGTISWAETYTALFGFFLMGCCYLAIGLYLSSVTESQVIAAVMTFLLLFVFYVMDGISSFFPETASSSCFTLAVLAAGLALLIYVLLNRVLIAVIFAAICEAVLFGIYFVNASFYEGMIQNILGVFNITDHFMEFTSGVFDVAGVVYYLTFSGVFLFLTVQSIQKRRWGRRLKNGSYSIVLSAVVIAGAVAVNLIASELPSQYTKIDVSEKQLSTLGNETKDVIRELDQDITMYYIVQDSSRDTNVSRLLERYADLSSHITVEEKDPVLYPNFASQFTDQDVSENSVIVTCGDVTRVVSYDSMYQSEFNYSYYTYETTGFDGEGQITSAIAAVSSDSLPKLCTLTGHGELTLSDTLAQSVEKENIETESLNLVTADQVPEDADCLLISSPTADISEAEAEKLLDYLKNGGKAVIVTDYTDKEMPNLASVLDYYGVSVTDGVVIEGDSNYYVQLPYYLVPDINSTEVSSDMAGGNNYVLLAAAQGIRTSSDVREGVSIESILSSSSSSYSKLNVENMTTYEKEADDIDGPFDLGVIITETVELTDEEETEENETEESETEEGETDAEDVNTLAAETAETKLAVFTSSSLLDASADQMVSGGNSKLFMNTLSWACGHTVTVSVPVKSLSVNYLTLTSASSSFWSIVVIGIIPGVFLIAGLFIWLSRRKR